MPPKPEIDDDKNAKDYIWTEIQNNQWRWIPVPRDCEICKGEVHYKFNALWYCTEHYQIEWSKKYGILEN